MTRAQNIKKIASLMGKRGGRARAEKLTEQERSEIARKGGLARQAKWREARGR